MNATPLWLLDDDESLVDQPDVRTRTTYHDPETGEDVGGSVLNSRKNLEAFYADGGTITLGIPVFAPKLSLLGTIPTVCASCGEQIRPYGGERNKGDLCKKCWEQARFVYANARAVAKSEMAIAMDWIEAETTTRTKKLAPKPDKNIVFGWYEE